jgi:hypothetical protein
MILDEEPADQEIQNAVLEETPELRELYEQFARFTTSARCGLRHPTC